LSEPKKKILHIDDDGLMQTIVRASLAAAGGFEVACASSGKEALEKLADYAPDLILLDVMLPEMSGPEIIERLKERIDITRTPVVFMTAKVGGGEEEQYRSLGAGGLIMKPFNPMTLHEQIDRIMLDFSCPKD